LPPIATRPYQRRRSARALSLEERQAVLDLVHEQRFCDQAPGEIYATLLEEKRYLCSVRTFYRILAEAGEVKERRAQRTHPVYKKPELLATAPNQVWSWDITKLRGPGKWQYFNLYVIIDIFSRLVVGWMVEERESAVLAERLISETCKKQGIQPGHLGIHADRGSAMTSKAVSQLLSELGVLKTHSRPHTSNDNPYSEAQFKTLKYCPSFPGSFGSLADARAFCRTFFDWYNQKHHHSGIGYYTPEQVHYGGAKEVLETRKQTLELAYAKHPERFVSGKPMPQPLPTAAWINPPAQSPLSRVDDPLEPLKAEVGAAAPHSEAALC
jgi:putative transposase